MRLTVKIAATLALSVVSSWVHADPSEKDVIKYRQQIMHTLNEQAAAIGQMMALSVPDENMPAHLEAVALAASVALKSFEPKVEGGESMPDVWTHWDDFAKRMNEFAQKTARVAELAKSGAKDDLLAEMTDALSCTSCHDVYRDPSAN